MTNCDACGKPGHTDAWGRRTGHCPKEREARDKIAREMRRLRARGTRRTRLDFVNNRGE
jgi:hypothetical protein